jgi:lactoylglutathione lyase
MIQKIFETHINVRSLERSLEFYGNVLGLRLGTMDSVRRVAFYWVGGHNVSMLGLWEKSSGEIGRQHFAFQISTGDFEHAMTLLRDNGIRLHNFLNDGTERPMVFGWMPAVSIYFPDPDGHELEFIAPLADKPRPDVGVVLWEQWSSIYNSPVA